MDEKKKITNDEVAKIALLARLDLSAEETVQYADQLNDILLYAEILQQVPTDDVEPTNHVLNLTNVYRNDEIKPSLSNEQALSNAPEQTDGTFVVPRIM